MFTCPWGTFTYCVLPFSLCNALENFQRVVLSIFYDLINEGIELYMDDFTPYDDEFNEALGNMENFLMRCIATRLCLSNENLSHVDDRRRRSRTFYLCHRHLVGPNKDRGNSQTSCCSIQKEVCSFHVGYYHRSIAHFSNIEKPLYVLMGHVEFDWANKCNHTFAKLKKLLSTTLVLRDPNWKLPFHMSSDVSNTSIEDVLGQEEEKNAYAIYYIRKNLTPIELKYIVTKKRFFGCFLCCL